MARPLQTVEQIIQNKLRKALCFVVVLLDDKDRTLGLNPGGRVYDFFDTGVCSVINSKKNQVHVGKLFTEKLRHKSCRVKVRTILSHLTEHYPELDYKPLVKCNVGTPNWPQYKMFLPPCVESKISARSLVELYNIKPAELSMAKTALDAWQEKHEV